MVNLRLHFIFLSLTILCTLRTTEGQQDNDNEDLEKIVGGTTTTINAIKYIIYMRRDGEFICDGSLVTTKHVVSAAHCVTKKGTGALLAVSRYTIHGGTSYLSQDGVVRKVTNIDVPADYNFQNTLTYDVSVLTLASPMTGPNVATIPLGASILPAGTTVRVSGWGLTQENGGVSNQLRTVTVKIISKQQCINDYKGEATVTQTMLCAAAPRKDACNGDSGGPLVYNGRLYGIVSWGFGCARARYPGVYTDVSIVKTFITKNIS